MTASTISPARSARIRAAHEARRITKPDLFHPVDPNARVRLTLPYPISANVYWRTVKRGKRFFTIVSDEAEAYKAEVARICRDADITPILGDVTLTIDLYRPRKAGDTSNRLKVCEDALSGFAFQDDCQVRHDDIQRVGEDKDDPRAEIEVRPWSPRAPLNLKAGEPNANA